MKDLTTILTVFLLTFGMVGWSSAQTTNDSLKTFEAGEKSSMKITGTSTVHDWEAEVKEFKTVLHLSPAATNVQAPKADHYKKISFQAPVKQIESGKSSMNKKIYDALKEKKHANITFSLNEVTNVSSTTEDTTFTLTLTGDLTIAGETQSITLNDVKGRKHPDGTYQYTGEISMKMTSFNVEPPSAMFGAIKAGDEITVEFDVYMKPDSRKTASN